MKKRLLASLLALLMVLSLLPATALVSSAEATTLTTTPSLFGNGAESWKDSSRNNVYFTQFLIGYSQKANNERTFQSILDEVGYTNGKWDAASNDWQTPPTCTKGHFDLTVTDVYKTVTVFKNIAPGSVYPGGESNLFRMEVNNATTESGKPFSIELNNVYTLTLDIYVGDTLTYTSTSSGYTFKVNESDPESGYMYRHGEKIEPTPAVDLDDLYRKPRVVQLLHYHVAKDSDIEDFGTLEQQNFAENLIIPEVLPSDILRTTEFAAGNKVEGKINNKEYVGSIHSYYGPLGVGNLFRVDLKLTDEDVDALDPGKVYATELKIYDADNRLMVIGLFDLRNGGFADNAAATKDDVVVVGTDGSETTYKAWKEAAAEQIAESLKPAPVEGSAKVTLTLANSTVRAGRTVDLTISASDLPRQGVNGWELKLSLPEGVSIVPDSFKPGTVDGATIMGGVNATEGTVFGVAAASGETGGNANISEDFTIGTVTLKADEAAAIGTGSVNAEVTDFFFSSELDPYEVDISGTTVVPADITVAKALTAVEGKDATCVEPGNKAYYKDDEGNLFEDADGLIPTTEDEVTIPATGEHTLTHHEAVPHTCTEDGTIEYWECSVCGKYFSDAEGQSEIADKNVTDPAAHTLTHHEATEPTETEPGNKEYWSCDVCGKLFLDEAATQETTIDEVTIPATGSGDLLGDLNGDEELTIADVTELLKYLSAPEGEINLQDVDSNGVVNIKDVSRLLMLLEA